jgi:hypothetical protein
MSAQSKQNKSMILSQKIIDDMNHIINYITTFEPNIDKFDGEIYKHGLYLQ